MEGSFDITVNDRGIRAMKQAIDFTLAKWDGSRRHRPRGTASAPS